MDHQGIHRLLQRVEGAGMRFHRCFVCRKQPAAEDRNRSRLSDRIRASRSRDDATACDGGGANHQCTSGGNDSCQRPSRYGGAGAGYVARPALGLARGRSAGRSGNLPAAICTFRPRFAGRADSRKSAQNGGLTEPGDAVRDTLVAVISLTEAACSQMLKTGFSCIRRCRSEPSARSGVGSCLTAGAR